MGQEGNRVEMACAFVSQAITLLDDAGEDVAAAKLSLVVEALCERYGLTLPGRGSASSVSP
jgi:hypothetical protein